MDAFRLAQPLLLGFRPRRPWHAPASFYLPGVTVASASDCLLERVLPVEPDWEHANTAFHYDSVSGAMAAAQRFGAENVEVHATRMWPVVFRGDSRTPFVMDLKRLDSGQVSIPDAGAPCTSLGFDVVCVSLANFSGHEHRCDWLPIDCAPLSCNGLCTEHPVNNWCLLNDLDSATVAATAFARDEPEPGPFVIVEVLRCET